MPIDISEYLNLVRTGTGVNDVRGAIGNASDALGVYLGASTDISQELETIRTGIYGRDIRQAIYDALYKLSQKEGGSTDFLSVTSDVFRVEDNVLTGEVTSDLSFGYGNWSYNSGADERLTTASVSIPAFEKPGTLAVCCMHRDTVTISGDGWTKLVDSVPATGGGVNQYITVWTKSRAGSREAETITVTQASSIRMALRVFDFYGTNVSLSVAGDEKISSFPYTPAANTGKRRLYLTSAIYADSSQCITLQSGFARTYANVRFCTFVDYMAGATDTPTFAYYSSYDANSANCLTLDITVNGE